MVAVEDHVERGFLVGVISYSHYQSDVFAKKAEKCEDMI
jgi:hypothetical protein